MQPNIVFLDEYSLGDADLGSIRALGNYTGYRTTVREEVADRCREADVVITNKVVFRRETLRQLPRLRLICVAATGMNHIDLEAAAELGIAVKNAVGYSTHAVTETTIGAAIGLLRQTVYYDRYVKTAYAGSPLQYHFGRTTHQLYGSKWGIVGLGNIGRSVARVAEALGCRIAYTSTSGVVREEPYPEKPLDELLRWADVVSVHAPLNDRTWRAAASWTKQRWPRPSTPDGSPGRGSMFSRTNRSKRAIPCSRSVNRTACCSRPTTPGRPSRRSKYSWSASHGISGISILLKTNSRCPSPNPTSRS